jgi:hypothetical protein
MKRRRSRMFNNGQKVEHVLSGDWVLVLKYDEVERKYLCRTKDLREIWFFEFELRTLRNI